MNQRLALLEGQLALNRPEFVSLSVADKTTQLSAPEIRFSRPDTRFSSANVMRVVLARGMRLTVVGVAIGLAGACGLTRLIGSLLFGITATDPATFAGVAALLMVVAFVASYLPARRAAKVDPQAALRYE